MALSDLPPIAAAACLCERPAPIAPLVDPALSTWSTPPWSTPPDSAKRMR